MGTVQVLIINAHEYDILVLVVITCIMNNLNNMVSYVVRYINMRAHTNITHVIYMGKSVPKVAS